MTTDCEVFVIVYDCLGFNTFCFCSYDYNKHIAYTDTVQTSTVNIQRLSNSPKI